MSLARRETLLWVASRASAAVLAFCVVVHLVTMIFAVRGGITAAEILGRTRGSITWAVFYGIFVVAVAIHGPLGLRTVLSEALQKPARALDVAMLLVGGVLLVAGLRAVAAVTMA